MGIVAWLVVGFIAGGLARRVTGAQKRGCLSTIVVGIVGAFIGGGLFNRLGGEGITHFGIRSILVAVVGACLLLVVLQLLGGGRRGRSR